MENSVSKRELMLAVTKLLKEITVIPSDKLKELQISNSSIHIAEDTVSLVGKTIKVRRIFFENASLKTAGWAINEDVSHCMDCGVKFGVIKRQHHCRQCGDIVCHKCSKISTIVQFKDIGTVKVCVKCFYATPSGGDTLITQSAAIGQNFDSSDISLSDDFESLPPMPNESNNTAKEDDTINPTYLTPISEEFTCGQQEDEQTIIRSIIEMERVNEMMGASNHQLNEKLHQTQEALIDLQKENKALRKKLNQNVRRSESNYDAALSQINLLRAQLSTQKEEVENLLSKNSKLEANNKKKMSNIKNLNARIATLESLLEEKLQHINELEQKIDRLQDAKCENCSTFKSHIAKLAGKESSLTRELEAREVAMKSLQQDNELVRMSYVHVKQVSEVHKNLASILHEIVDVENTVNRRDETEIIGSLQNVAMQLKKMVSKAISTPGVKITKVEVDDLIGIDSSDYLSPMRN